MKKLYSLLIATATTLPGFAQLTLHQSDLPIPGLAFTMGTDTAYSAPITAGGPAQSWNYSGLLNTATDTVAFLSAAGTPYASQFPSANLVTVDPSSGTYSYYISNASGFYQNGFNDSGFTGGVAQFNPALIFVRTPFTYLDTAVSDARLVVYFTDTSTGTPINIKVVETAHSNLLADGWGSLTLPSGTHNNTLRVAVTQHMKDSLFADLTGLGIYTLISSDSSTNLTYRWFGPGPASYLLGIDMDSLGTTAVRSEYLLNYILLGTQQVDVKNHSLLLYPSPAADRLTVQWDAVQQPVTLQIIDVSGRQVYSATVQNFDRVTVPVNRMANGIYNVRMQMPDGTVQTERFVVSH